MPALARQHPLQQLMYAADVLYLSCINWGGLGQAGFNRLCIHHTKSIEGRICIAFSIFPSTVGRLAHLS